MTPTIYFIYIHAQNTEKEMLKSKILIVAINELHIYM